jgi:hypothetical protein
MASTVPLWQSILGVLAVVGFVAVPSAAVVWAHRRRRRGEEASIYNAEGAEALISIHGGSTNIH